MRDRDLPDEVLEDEDITSSLPRRLGLSEVVRLQIQRLQEEVKHRRPQVTSQVEDLVKLVNRRPDAVEIFIDVGSRVARRYWEQRSAGMKGMVRVLPRPLAQIAAVRAGRRMFRDLVGPTRVTISRRPLTLRIEDTLTARADPTGKACAFYTGAFTELLELYTNRRYRVLHLVCACRLPGQPCEWSVEIAS